jgi:hypothetical protein
MDEIASVAAAAGTFVAGYLAQGAKQLGDKVRDGAVERLWQLIEPHLRGTVSGSAALDHLAEQPNDPSSATMVGAVLADAANADPRFATQLEQAVRDVHHSQGGAGATAGAGQVIVTQDRGSRFRTRDFALGNIDKSKRTVRVSTGGIFMGIVALVAVLGATTVISYNIGGNDGAADAIREFESRVFPTEQGKSNADIAAEGGGTYRSNLVLSTNPYEATRSVYQAIAQNAVPQACGRMREDVQTTFATDEGFPNCPAAVAALARQVTNKNDYAESLPSYVGAPLPGDTITVRSCDYDLKGGPALGVFTLTKVEKDQWLITGHSPGPATCTGR